MHDFSNTRPSGGRPAISVVIPAYNEAGRLPAFLRELLAYLEREYARAYEVVVVDDGSSDGLASVLHAEQFECGVRNAGCGIEEAGARDGRIALLRHEVNRGKGAALRTGVLASVGGMVLLCDADGAARMGDECLLRSAMANGADIAVGSRSGRRVEKEKARVMRHPVRRAAGWIFSRVVRTMFDLKVRDTQCGFKMLRGDAARLLFASVRETGYLVDLELLLLAKKQGYRVEEVPVSWQEMPGSKLSLWKTAWPAATGLWRLHRRMRMSGGYESRNSTPMPSPHTADRASHHVQKRRGSKSYRSKSKA